jgi:hypothetical protein
MARRALDLADWLQPLARRHVEARHGVQQRLEVGMLRVAEDVAQIARLDHLATIHHHDVVGDVGDHTEIVGDHQQGHTQLFLQILDEAQDLGLDGDIECSCRLVGDQQRRPADQRHGDHGALAQAARQLERIGAQRALGVGEAHHTQHVGSQFVDLRPRQLAPLPRPGGIHSGRGTMQLDRLADLVAHGVERRERSHGFLEDDGDLAAADASHGGPRAVELGDVDNAFLDPRILEQDRARRDCRGARQQTHDRLAAHRLARARFAHQRDGAARRDREGDLVDGAQDAFMDTEIDGQVLDTQQILHTVSS